LKGTIPKNLRQQRTAPSRGDRVGGVGDVPASEKKKRRTFQQEKRSRAE